MGWKQLQTLPSTKFNFSYQWKDIVFAKDGIHTLANIIIAKLIKANLFLRSCATQWSLVFDVIQTKKKSYHDQHPIDQFLPCSN
jgi:hypothetical protein